MFHFQLFPVEEIQPWGDSPPTLHWFGLTMGWFWIEISGQELFRYTDAARKYWESQDPDCPPHALPYEDYQVARYWEDLVGMLPEILDLIPDDLAALVADGQVWEAWQAAARTWMEVTDTDHAWETHYAAVGWWGKRTWDAGHLAHPPCLWLWRVGETVHLRWDNRTVTVGDGIPVWTATAGEYTLPVADFIAHVTAFNDRFLAAMAARLQAVQTHWSRPEILLDFGELTQSQATAAKLLDANLNPWAWDIRRGISWDTVRAAINEITPTSG